MIEENSSETKYLTTDDIAELHRKLSSSFEQGGEPIPSFERANQKCIDALVEAPRQKFYGVDAYPTIEEKAAIIFYTINKQQMFVNGNKRMSTLCLLVFLEINGRSLEVMPDALTDKALWLANTASLDFQAIKSELIDWIRSNTKAIT